MKKIIRPRRTWWVWLIILLALAGCSQPSQPAQRWPHKNISHAVEKFVVSDNFMKYNAIKDAFSNQGLYTLYPKSLADAKRTGDTRYHVTVQGQVYPKRKHPYAPYVTFDLSATPQNGGITKSAKNFGMTSSHFNKWLRISNIKVNAKRVALLDKQGVGGVTVQGIFPDKNGDHINSAYKLLQPSFPITDHNELATYYMPDSGDAKAILTMLNANDWKKFKLPQTTQDNLLKGMKQLNNKKLNYLQVDRISKSYYAVELFEDATGSQAKGLLIVKDTDDNDAKLASLQFVTAKTINLKMN